MIYKKSWKYILVKCNYFYRPKALKNFSDVSKDDIGGHLEGYHNLSQTRDCWVYDKAKVTGNAKIFENAKIFGYSRVCGDAKVYGNARIYDSVTITGNVQVLGIAQVSGCVYICKDVIIKDKILT
jgi:UDP-3-O-[3-hydroxymyristoyl] glucosamine N-acyltransferase